MHKFKPQLPSLLNVHNVKACFAYADADDNDSDSAFCNPRAKKGAPSSAATDLPAAKEAAHSGPVGKRGQKRAPEVKAAVSEIDDGTARKAPGRKRRA
jgi:hypothetical protein